MYERDDIHFHSFLTGMRTGKNITLEQLGRGLCSAAEMIRIETGERLPDKLMRDRLTERLGIENDGFEDFLQPEEYELWQELDSLLQAVERRDAQAAERLLGQIRSKYDNENPVLRQFLLVMKAQLMEYEGASEEKLRKVYGEALTLTVPDAATGKWRESLLAPQEWNLLSEYIRHGGDAGTAAGTGSVVHSRSRRECDSKVTVKDDTSVLRTEKVSRDPREEAYESFLTALQSSSPDLCSYAKIYPKAVYCLCLTLMKDPSDLRACRRVLQLSADAVEVLRSSERMYYLCELLKIMEQALSVLTERSAELTGKHAPDDTNTSEIFDRVWSCLAGKQEQPPQPADFFPNYLTQPGHLEALSAQIREWHHILTGLYREYGVPERTENCCYLYRRTHNYRIGDVVRRRRKMLGLSVKELCDGICSEKTLRRLEHNKLKTQRAIWTKLFMKLGLSPEFQRKRIVTERYDAMVLYESMTKALNNNATDKTSQLLQQLKEILCMDIPLNRQETELVDCLNQFRKKMLTAEECVSRLKKILEYTIPLESIIHATDEADLYLTCGELICLYNIVMKSENKDGEININLLWHICEQYALEAGIAANISTCELVMDGVASYLGDMGEYEQSDQISDRTMKECLSARRMGMLHLCLYNKLWNHMEVAQKSTYAEPHIPTTQELRKCIQLAKLCKDPFYEKFYVEKSE